MLVVTNFAIGLLSLTTNTNTDEKPVPLGAHIVLGISILLLIMARFTLRMFVASRLDDGCPVVVTRDTRLECLLLRRVGATQIGRASCRERV